MIEELLKNCREVPAYICKDGFTAVYLITSYDLVPKYVGISDCPVQRFGNHLSTARALNSRGAKLQWSKSFYEWIWNQIKNNKMPRMFIIEESEVAFGEKRERYFIDEIRNQGYELLNYGILQNSSKYDLDNMAKALGGFCLSEQYISSTSMCRWSCGKNHEFEKSYNQVRAGLWCATCNKEQRKLRGVTAKHMELERKELVKSVIKKGR